MQCGEVADFELWDRSRLDVRAVRADLFCSEATDFRTTAAAATSVLLALHEFGMHQCGGGGVAPDVGLFELHFVRRTASPGAPALSMESNSAPHSYAECRRLCGSSLPPSLRLLIF